MRPLILAIGGSDPSGGAGIEADLQTIRELGGHGMAVATALTVQDTVRVHDVVGIDADVVSRRLQVLLDDVTPAAVKVGMLGHGDVARAVAETLPHDVPLVVDPVIVSSSGAMLLDDEGVEVLRSSLIARADVVLPNRDEARRLLGIDEQSGALLAAGLVEMGARAVLVTGGDASSDASSPDAPEVTDHYCDATGHDVLRSPRVPGPSPHGTGCALSTAIAVRLARGDGLRAAIEWARLWVREGIASARPAPGSDGAPLLRLGQGDDG